MSSRGGACLSEDRGRLLLIRKDICVLSAMENGANERDQARQTLSIIGLIFDRFYNCSTLLQASLFKISPA